MTGNELYRKTAGGNYQYAWSAPWRNEDLQPYVGFVLRLHLTKIFNSSVSRAERLMPKPTTGYSTTYREIGLTP